MTADYQRACHWFEQSAIAPLGVCRRFLAVLDRCSEKDQGGGGGDVVDGLLRYVEGQVGLGAVVESGDCRRYLPVFDGSFEKVLEGTEDQVQSKEVWERVGVEEGGGCRGHLPVSDADGSFEKVSSSGLVWERVVGLGVEEGGRNWAGWMVCVGGWGWKWGSRERARRWLEEGCKGAEGGWVDEALLLLAVRDCGEAVERQTRVMFDDGEGGAYLEVGQGVRELVEEVERLSGGLRDVSLQRACVGAEGVVVRRIVMQVREGERGSALPCVYTHPPTYTHPDTHSHTHT